MPTRDDIQAAAQRIAGHVRRTPILQLGESIGLGAPITLKLEQLQVTGSFKPRGAFNALLLAESLPAAGIVAASGGNHGLAVAHAARVLGHPVEIFVPETTPVPKCERIMAAGAKLTLVGSSYAEARIACEARAAETGAFSIHAYDEEAVLAGQGTVGLELEADAPGLTHVLVAVGGGGLYGGIASWYGEDVQIIPVEPDNCATLTIATVMNQRVDVSVGGVASDSLGAVRVGGLAFDIAQRVKARPIVVADGVILAAQRGLWDMARILAEPGGACAFAALISGAWVPPPGARVGVVVCGANCDPATVSG